MKKALAQRNMNTLAAWPLLPGLRQRPLVALKLGPPLLAPVCPGVHALTQKKI